MGYAQRLITRILADEQARKGAAGAGKVYRDEPILRTGADLLRERSSTPAEDAVPRPAATCELPPLLQELRALQRGLDARLVPEGKAFVQQALLVAAYEDDYAYDGDFRHYFPSYRHMTDEQLRGYFSWRTRVRRGDMRKASLSFAFVHLYELVNGIGPAGRMEPREGYAALQGFCRAYGEIDARILRYARAWCRDYAVYHGIDATLPPDEAAREEALRTLMALDGGEAGGASDADGAHGVGDRPAAEGIGASPVEESASSSANAEGSPCAAIDDEALFDALVRLSSYRIEKSRLMRDHAPLLKAAVCCSWRALSAYYRAHRRSTLSEHLFGAVTARPYAMFGAAVFWQRERHPDCRRQVGPITRFVCEDGRWLREGPYRALSPSREAGSLLKAVDAALRRRLECEAQLKGAAVPKYAQRIIERQVEGVAAEERRRAEREAEAQRRRVTIDFSKLASIRTEAAASCEALLTDEEREGSGGAPLDPRAGAGRRAAYGEREGADEGPGAPAPPAAKPASDPSPAPSSTPADGSPAAPPSPLSEAEASYLLCLLEDGAPENRGAALKEAGTSPALLMDAINEKLFDELGDVALVEGDAGPQLLEDYREDVRRIIAA